MWTTSSSRVERCGIGLLAGVVLVGCLVAALDAQPASHERIAQQMPPDAPRPAKPQTKESRPRGGQLPVGTVELSAVTVGRVTGSYGTLVGPEFMRSAHDPIYIEVQTAKPLGNVWRDSAPVILLNDERLKDTWPVGADRLVAFLPDRTKLKDVNTIAVEWVGEQAATKTKRPLTFKREDVGK